MICLYIQAPFAVFRTFTAGNFRPTAGFLTHSAAYGLALNIAGIDSRLDNGESAMTLMRTDLPNVRIALGALSFPQLHSLYQQGHNYPVGNTGAERAPLTKGNKYNITPIRRELLSNLCAYVCLNENSELEERVRNGLAGHYNSTRYGLPFLGDNNFLIDILREERQRQPAYWYETITESDSRGPRPRTTHLTLSIDRQNMAKTKSALFAPSPEQTLAIPENAWILVPN
ncbi:MAG: CRISPR-associated protein Cas5 [Candidatus Binatia bacterium]